MNLSSFSSGINNNSESLCLYSLFQSPWWLEAVAPSDWGEVSMETSGATIARWPYVIKKKFGFTFLVMPRLTQCLGPWLRPIKGKYAHRLSAQRGLIEGLLEQLPHFDFFWQTFHPSVTDWLPLYWRGFRQTTKYTYIIDNLANLDEIWNGMTEQTRRAIRKAEKNYLKVEVSEDLETLLCLNSLTFARQNMPLPYSISLVHRIDAACHNRSARKIFLAYDRDGRAHSALYLVYDKEAAYYLMGGIDPVFKDRQGMALTVWESIKFAATVTKVYDFEGSMVQPIERFVRGFGAVQTPYHSVIKCNSKLMQMVFDINAWLKINSMARNLIS
jgi:hypothetical protein